MTDEELGGLYANMNSLFPKIKDVAGETMEFVAARNDYKTRLATLKAQGKTEEMERVRAEYNSIWAPRGDDIERGVAEGSLPEGVLQILETADSLSNEDLSNYIASTDLNAQSVLNAATLNTLPDILSAWDNIVKGQDYGESRKKYLDELETFRTLHPVKAIATDVGTAFIPGFGAGKALSKGSKLSRAGKAAGAGALVGGISAAGADPSASWIDRAATGVMGSGLGALMGGSVAGVMDAATPFARSIRRKLGLGKDEAAEVAGDAVEGAASDVAEGVASPVAENVVRRISNGTDTISRAANRELRRIADKTGKSREQLIDEIVETGVPLSANETTHIAIKSALHKEGAGGALQEMIDRSGRMAKEGKEEVSEMIHQGLSPQHARGQTRKQFEEGEELRRKEVSGQYQRLLDNSDVPVSPEISDQVESVLDRFGDAKNEIKKHYKESGLPQLFEEGPAGVKLIREPSIRDAEEIRKSLSETSSKLYNQGKGTRAATYEQASDSLRENINKLMPEMKQARRNWQAHKSREKAFSEGNRYAESDLELMDYKLDKLRREDEKMRLAAPYGEDEAGLMSAADAYRAGVATKTERMLQKPGTGLNRLADEGSVQRAVLDTALPEGISDELGRKIKAASSMDKLTKLLPATSGSQTQPLLREGLLSRLSNLSLPDLSMDGLTGMGGVVLRRLTDKLGDTNLSEADFSKIVEALSTTDRRTLQELMFMPEETFEKVLRGDVRATAQDAGLMRLTDLLNRIGLGAATSAAGTSGGEMARY